MAATKLKIVSEPLAEPIGRGRVILQDKAVPMRGDDPSIELVCGSCSTPLVVGLHPITFWLIFGNAEVLIRCNRCQSYNDVTPAPPGPYHLDTDLLDHIKSLLSHATKARNDLFQKFQNLGLQDPRISVAGHLLDVVSATFLNLVHVKDNLRKGEWWENHGYGAAVKAGMLPGLLENYMALTTGSLMFFSFSLFESGIRRLVRAIDPVAAPEVHLSLREFMIGYLLGSADKAGTTRKAILLFFLISTVLSVMHFTIMVLFIRQAAGIRK